MACWLNYASFTNHAVVKRRILFNAAFLNVLKTIGNAARTLIGERNERFL